MRSGKISRQGCGRRRTLAVFISIAMLLALPVVCTGQNDSVTRFVSQDQGRPLTITSSRMTLNNQLNTIIFEGNVTIAQDAMTLKADTVDAVFEPAAGSENGHAGGAERKRALSTITATGDIKFIQGLRTVYANRAVYFKKDEKVVFTGSPNIREGQDELRGEKITVFILEDRVVVEGGEAIIHPK